MKRLALLTLVIAAGCWTTGSPTTDPTQPPGVTPPGEIAVELSAVTLGDDCGDHGHIPPPPPSKIVAQAPARRMPPGEAPAASAAPCPVGGNCGYSHRAACDQTSMQLAIDATGGAKPATIKIKTVELLDAAGKVLAVLTTRAPSRWSDDAYIGWDETVAPNQHLAASYLLSSPDWNTLTDGRWNAHTKTFQLRVTLTVNDKDRTFDKQSITPAMLEPIAPT